MAPPSLEGNILGKYRLVVEIARGGMGIVYLAAAMGPAGFSKLMVLKELKPELTEDPAFLTMFLDEARLAARLNHRNIVQTNEVGEDHGRHYLAMEYLEGRSLQRVMRRAAKRGSSLPLMMNLRILCEMLSGLHYAHELTSFDGNSLGVVHRDVSPNNVFVTFDGQVKVVDFGVAVAADRLQETRAGTVKGRVPYMAPEHARGDKVDRRADVFAAGAMLWEALTGKRVWDGKTDVDVLRSLFSGQVPVMLPTEGVPEELRAICNKALRVRREDRYATAHEMRVALEQWLTESRDHTTVSDIGAFVANLFAPDRARVRAMIDQELARLASGEVRQRLATLELSRTTLTGTTDITGTDVSPTLSIPRLPAYAVGIPPSGPSIVTPSLGTLPSGTTPETPREQLRVPRSRAYFGAGVFITAVMMIGIILYAAVRPGKGRPVAAAADSAPAASTSPGAATTPPTPAPTATAVDSVEINVRATPSTARIFIDDAAVDGNPFRARFPRGTKPHGIRAVAPGYRPKSEEAVFDTNVSVSLSLEREAAPPAFIYARPTPPPAPPPPPHEPDRPKHDPAPAPAPPPPPAPPPAPAAQDINPGGGKQPRHTVDPSSPYDQP